ncbi:hypothetical protein ETB97_007263 [Aspergillus alliaceus]|uniref:Major facilitator superfamily (MFS) profile domain-containing protein n=1 Tax=Petromyces alliaceus TaxID=209559 RepID=A0A8H5ZTF8_PETAA|nr:hypothetical protein ETB97_007263 [Aspergillus burnettii]
MSSSSEQNYQNSPVITHPTRDSHECGEATENSAGEEEKASHLGLTVSDPNSVNWDGPTDPANPRNWKRGRKLIHILALSAITLYANLAAIMFAPAAQQFAMEFRVTSGIVATLTVTIFILGFAIGPLLLAPMSELYGRLIIYHVCNVVHFAFTIGCWRWTFWLILILSGATSLLTLIVMRETYEPALLERKAARLRKATGNSELRAQTSNKRLNSRQLLGRAVIRPAKILLLSPIALLLAIYTAFMFGLVYLLFTTFPVVFQMTYGFSIGITGLAYLGLGLGMMLSLILFGVLSDRLLHQPRGATIARPELRLLLMVWLSPVVPIGFFWYGWSAEAKVHWIVPILGTFFIGITIFLILIPSLIYLIDAFGPEAAASAVAGNMVLRSLFGTFIPLAGPYLYKSLGLGWGNSLLAFISVAFVPVPFFFYKYGERLRMRFPVDY